MCLKIKGTKQKLLLVKIKKGKAISFKKTRADIVERELLNRFRPTWMVESIYDLSPEQLKKQGIKVVLTDLDNTLIAWDNPSGTPQLHEWLKEMRKAKIPVVVVSNNKHERIKKALDELSLPFIARALKPLTRGINVALKRYHVKRSEVVLVGDQLMTDVLAANNAQIKSILVRPLVDSDAWNTKINRFFERLVKKRLVKTNRLSTKWGHKLDD